MYNGSRLIITGDGLWAQNTDGVASFTKDSLSIRSDGGIISISGDNLVIVTMEDSAVTVSGKIRAVNII